jgi:hypothetical protein
VRNPLALLASPVLVVPGEGVAGLLVGQVSGELLVAASAEIGSSDSVRGRLSLHAHPRRHRW